MGFELSYGAQINRICRAEDNGKTRELDEIKYTRFCTNI